MSPLIPLAILLMGAGVLALTVLPRLAFTAPVALGGMVLAWGTLAALGLQLPASATLSSWAPVELLPVGLVLRVDGPAWLLGMGLASLALSALLTGLARPGGPRVPARTAMLALTFAGLTALFADNLVTLLMAWAGLDFIYFFTLILLARGEGVQPQAVLHLSFNSFGTVLMLAAAIVVSASASDLTLQAAVAQPSSTVLVTLAAVFRLGLFPLHLALPLDVEVRQGLGTLLRLIPTAVALDVIARLAALGFADVLRPWLTLFGVAAVVLGAAQLWSSDDVRRGLAHVIIAQSGLALLAGVWGGGQAGAAVVALALALVLGGGLFNLSHGFDAQRRWLSAFPGLGVAVLAGIPFTVGFSSLSGVYAAWQTAGGGLWLVLLVVALSQAFLIAALVRVLLWPGEPLEGGAMGMYGYLIGLALLATLAVAGGALGAQLAAWLNVAGLGFDFGNGLPLAMIALSTLIGLGLWRFESIIRARTEAMASIVLSLLRLDWLYRWLWGALRQIGNAVGGVAQVLEGEGAMLWALVVVLAIVLLFR
jgi:formate hydrogenlyase subunit 3/multisubunit Na+/H+ antiporter MnhD subunit